MEGFAMTQMSNLKLPKEERVYYRPLVQFDAPCPKHAVSLAGTRAWFSLAVKHMRSRPDEVVCVSDVPADVLDTLRAPRAQVAGLDLTAPKIMGILNVTPDSFSDGGLFATPQNALAHAKKMQADGADILDIGGESTRPGAAYVPSDVEIERTEPVIKAVRAHSSVPISIDTRKADVAQAALAAGASLVNDVYAFTHDPDLARITAQADAPVCLMHAQGDPEVMQDSPAYENVLLDVYDFLEERIAFALKQGIKRQNIVVDPGIGFGKTLAHNLELLNKISIFHGLGCPILLGASRKRFIGTISDPVSDTASGTQQAHERVSGSVAVALAGAAQGVQILRVHDIKETKQALAVWQAVSSGEYNVP